MTSPHLDRRVWSARLFRALRHVDLREIGMSRVVEASRRLRDAQDRDSADRLLERQLARRPKSPLLLLEYARSAGTHPVAVERWRRALAAAPSRPASYIGLSHALGALGDNPAAKEVIDTARRLFPDDAHVLVEAASGAEARGDLEAAEEAWARACARLPREIGWRRHHAWVLARLNRFDEADAVVDTALASSAKSSKRTSKNETGNLVSLRGFIGSARHEHQIARENHDAPAPAATQRSQSELLAPIAIDHVVDEATRHLLLGFESLGDTCEFGLVQRRYGAEPLGLFRWNTVSVEPLVSALGDRLAGIGDPANTELYLSPTRQFMVRDRRWGFLMHTWLYPSAIDETTLHRQMCRRLVFLRDKLLDDLERAEKVFVFRADAVDRDELDRLHRALRAIGPVRLLAVTPPGRAAASLNDVEEIADGLFDARVRPGINAAGGWDIPFDDWVDVCAKIAAHVRAP